MRTIGWTETTSDGTRKSRSGSFGARTDMAEIVLLIVTILVLMGVAAGITIEFPMALEAIAIHANAATDVSSAPHTPDRRAQSAEETEQEVAPFVTDDIRAAGFMHASVEIAGESIDRSAPAASGINC